jgi:ABC-2 type transport system permease protein
VSRGVPSARARARPGFLLVFRRELRRIRRRPTLAVLTTLLPLLLFGLLAAVFHAGLPTDLPVAVADLDRTETSRALVRAVDASPDVAVTERVEDLQAGRRLILEGAVVGVVLLPVNLARDLAAGRRPEVVVFHDNQHMTAGSIVGRAAGAALRAASAAAGASALAARGEAPARDPLVVRQSALFNPSLDYVYFLLAALVPAVLQIFVCTVSAYAVGLERRAGTAGLRVLRRLGGGSLWPALLGKLLPYTLLHLITLGIADAVLFGRLGMPFRGDVRLFVLAGVLFVLAYQLVGALLGLLARDAVTAVSVAGLLTAPAFPYAGVSFPRLGMGAFASAWSALLPLTWYLQVRVDQALRGAPYEIGIRPVGYLAATVAALLALTALRVVSLRRPAPAATPAPAPAAPA